MNIFQKTQEALSKIELVNASKIYTPFTVFCLFFAIYFNAETLGKVFLSGKWDVQLEALKMIGAKDFQSWFAFLGKVFMYGAAVTLLYGLAQVVSGIFWMFTTKLNIWMAYLMDKKGYVSIEEKNDLVTKLAEMRKDEKKLHEELNNYRKWSPEQFAEFERNEQELSNLKANYAGLEKNFNDQALEYKKTYQLLENEKKANKNNEEENLLKVKEIEFLYGLKNGIKYGIELISQAALFPKQTHPQYIINQMNERELDLFLLEVDNEDTIDLKGFELEQIKALGMIFGVIMMFQYGEAEMERSLSSNGDFSLIIKYMIKEQLLEALKKSRGEKA